MTPSSTVFSKLTQGVVTHTVAESHELARELVDCLPPALTLALSGKVGAGKTTFTQGLAKALGVNGPVTSPTFAIFNLHEGHDRRLIHLDAYRLNGPGDLDALLLDEFLIPPYLLVCEWPEIVLPALPGPIWWLDLGLRADGLHFLRLAEAPHLPLSHKTPLAL